MEHLLNIEEVAEMLDVEESTVYGWTHRKAIPYIKLGRLIRFQESEIMKWLESKAVAPGSQNSPPAKPKGRSAKVNENSSEDFVDRLVENAKKRSS